MKVKNVTGYMLANNGAVLLRGDQWWPYDTEVFICLNLDKAKQIIGVSAEWTTIYRVRAAELECSRIDGGLMYTNDASKIIVDAPVHYNDRRLSETQLLARAASIRDDFMKLAFNSKGKKK